MLFDLDSKDISKRESLPWEGYQEQNSIPTPIQLVRDDPKESHHTCLLTLYMPKLNLTPATAVSVPGIIIVGYLMFPDPYRSATPDLEFQARKYFAWERKERERESIRKERRRKKMIYHIRARWKKERCMHM